MRNYFFERGEELRLPQGQFILANNRLDSRFYALERVEQPPPNYVPEFYSTFEHKHLLKYMTCWNEEESVPVKPQPEKKPNSSSSKKKGLGLQAFLSRKKIQQGELKGVKKVEGLVHEAKQDQAPKVEYTKVDVLYVQLETFKPINIPKSVKEIKDMMALIYLLAQRVHQDKKEWPYMIPVVNAEGKFKFVKRGFQKNKQLARLFQFLMRDAKAIDWSPQMESIYQMSEINGDSNLLGQKICYDLDRIIKAEYPIVQVVEGVPKQEMVKILCAGVLCLGETGLQIPLDDFTITVCSKGDNVREITLEHQFCDDIILECEAGGFICSYLSHLKIS